MSQLNELIAAFKKFLCTVGTEFYNLATPSDTFTLVKEPQTVSPLYIGDEQIKPMPCGLKPDEDGNATIPWKIIL